MEVHQLRYFAKLAALEHFTRAAEACHVSQPSLSQQIAKLEAEIGRPLFERTGRGVRLTEAGRRFRAHIEPILGLLDDAKASVADDAESGRVRLAAIPTIAPYFLPRLLTRFAEAVPRAHLDVSEEVTAVLTKQLLEGEVDLALMALPVPHADLDFTEVLTEELLAVFPAHHPLANQPGLSLRDLADEPFVLLSEAHCLADATVSFCRPHVVRPVSTARVQQLTTVQELVRLGHGVSLIPAMAARLDPHSGRVYRSLTGEKPMRTIIVAWAKMRYRTQLQKRLIEEMGRSAVETPR